MTTRAAMLKNVAPVAPEGAVSALERSVLVIDDLETMRGCRRYVHVVRSPAYDAELFSRCMPLLEKIAAAGDLPEKSNLALEAYTSLFQLRFSGTYASIEQRLEVIRPLLLSDEPAGRRLGLKALESALEGWHFKPFHDFEFGARSRDYGYWPRSPGEVKHWFGLTLKLSAELACGDKPVGSQVRTVVARQLRGAWTRAHTYEEIEDACRTISQKQFWPEGWIAARQIRHHDSKGLTPEVLDRLEALEALLRLRDLIQRVRSIVLFEGLSAIYVTDIEDGGTADVAQRRARAGAIARDLG